MARIAIPHWKGMVSPVFDAARELLVIDTTAGSQARWKEPFSGSLMPRRVHRLKELGIDVVVCGGISNPLRAMTEAAGIRVIPWMSGPVDEVLAAYSSGSLGDGRFTMPGGRGPKGPRYRGGRGGGIGRGGPW